MIQPYGEALWAELRDERAGPIEPSLSLLAALHQRWIGAWKGLQETEWAHLPTSQSRRGVIRTIGRLVCVAWPAPCCADPRVAGAERLGRDSGDRHLNAAEVFHGLAEPVLQTDQRLPAEYFGCLGDVRFA